MCDRHLFDIPLYAFLAQRPPGLAENPQTSVGSCASFRLPQVPRHQLRQAKKQLKRGNTGSRE